MSNSFKLCPKHFPGGAKNFAEEFAPWLCLSRSGQLIWLGSNFDKAAYGLKQVSVQVSLNINVYCDELEDISDLKIFLNASAGHWKRCGGLYVARKPLFAYPCSIVHRRMIAKDWSEWRWTFSFLMRWELVTITLMCGTKRLNPFFRLQQAIEVLNKYVMGMWSNWSYNFTATFSLVSMWLFLFLISRDLRIKQYVYELEQLFNECNEHV